jgi:hypothetical protein
MLIKLRWRGEEKIIVTRLRPINRDFRSFKTKKMMILENLRKDSMNFHSITRKSSKSLSKIKR